MTKSNRKKTITLAMIVKNEAHVIERCLDSVAPFVDNILIHDTGSDDDTVEVITKYIKKNRLHGFVERVDWVDFGHNRSLVLKAARSTGDYTFMLDADETLEGDAAEFRTELSKLDRDIYSMRVKLGDLNFSRHFLFKNSLEWKYLDPIHEYAHCDDEFVPGDIVHAHILSHHDGARSKRPEKYFADAMTLIEYDKKHGTSPRRTFYTAQCLKDAGKLKEAVAYYKNRVDMEDGWWQERYFSFYQIGLLTKDPKALLEAYLLEPLRAEPLLYLGKILMDQQNWNAAEPFLRKATELDAAPENALFVEQDIYNWRADLEYAVCLYYLARYDMAACINEILLKRKTLPEAQRDLVKRNLQFCQEKLS